MTTNQTANQIDQSWHNVVKVVASDSKGSGNFHKVVLRPVATKGGEVWQAEQYKGVQVFHANIERGQFEEWFCRQIAPYFRQVVLFCVGTTITFNIGASGQVKRSVVQNDLQAPAQRTNDRQKEYILKEGESIPALVELGIFTQSNKVAKGMYDKFKQINRFIEVVEHSFSDKFPNDLTVVDFGCGKSYLTFLLYHYFEKIKGIKATIYGFDLKKDVVNDCNLLAKKYRYDRLHFAVGDIATAQLDVSVDMMVTLHACDKATDYALAFAVKKGIERIFCVPCCQHEVCLSIAPLSNKKDIMLSYGLIKERFSALLTDAVRMNLLEKFGYKVDALEFVDFSHSPKNLMIRAVKKQTSTQDEDRQKQSEKQPLDLLERYSFDHTLLKLLD